MEQVLGLLHVAGSKLCGPKSPSSIPQTVHFFLCRQSDWLHRWPFGSPYVYEQFLQCAGSVHVATTISCGTVEPLVFPHFTHVSGCVHVAGFHSWISLGIINADNIAITTMVITRITTIFDFLLIYPPLSLFNLYPEKRFFLLGKFFFGEDAFFFQCVELFNFFADVRLRLF